MRRSLRSSAGRLVSRPVRWRRSKDFVSEIDQLTASSERFTSSEVGASERL
jgi:hypothetical protein